MTLLQSFAANFIVRDLTLKGLIETDTLYLVFKDRIVLDSSLRSVRSKLGWVRNYSSCLYEEDILPSKRAF